MLVQGCAADAGERAYDLPKGLGGLRSILSILILWHLLFEVARDHAITREQAAV
jgi:hypothetical protein